MHTGSGLGRKAATLVCEFERLAFVYFVLVGLTSVGSWNFWKPLTADYVAAGVFSFRKMAPQIFGSPQLVGTLPQAFFSRKITPIFLEAPNLWVRCRRRFFLRKIAPIFLEAPNLGAGS